MIINFISFGLLRLVPAVGMLLFTLLSVRLLGEEDASEIILYSATLYLLGFFGRGGIDLYMLKEVSVLYQTSKAKARRLLRKASREVLLVSIIVSALALLVLGALDFSASVYWYSILPVFTLLSINSMTLRAVKYEYRGVLLEAGTASLIASLFLIVYFICAGEVSLFVVYLCYSLSIVFVWLVQIGIVYGLVDWGEPEPEPAGGESLIRALIILSSWRYSVVNVCSYLILWLPAFMVSKVSALAVVIIGVAIRLSSVPGFLVSTIDAMVAPRVARLYAAGELLSIKAYLESLKKYLVFVSISLVVFSYPVFYFIEKMLLQGEPSGVAGLAYIAVVSHAVSLYLGPVGYVLLMTGYEAIQKNLKIYMLIVMGVGGAVIVIAVKDTYLACLFMVGLMAAVRIAPNIIMARKVAKILEGAT